MKKRRCIRHIYEIVQSLLFFGGVFNFKKEPLQ